MYQRKFDELVVYLGSHPHVKNLGTTKLWKLIYFVDASALREIGATITGSEFIKYEHGPVPSRGEKRLRHLVRAKEVATTPRLLGGKTLHEVKSLRKPDLSVFTPEELTLVNAICDELGSATAKFLSDKSHLEPSWYYAAMLEKLSPTLMVYGATEDPEGL